jgi:PKD repeat protein
MNLSRLIAVGFVIAAMTFVLGPTPARADFCDPWQACDSDGDCGQGVCINTVCQCGAEEGRPLCGDNCSDRGLLFSPGGDTVHIDDCRGINSGPSGGVISYCFTPTCAPDAGSSCSASNSCGMTNDGTIQCDGSCDASPPPESACGNAPVGWHSYADCTITGDWTFDPDYAGSIPVQIYRDGPAGGGGTFMATVTANIARPDVETWAQAVGYSPPNRTNSGWQWLIPASMKDGLPHTIYAYATNVNSSGTPSGSNPLLSGSPRTITCADPPTGTLASATCGNASGTASDAQGAPVTIAVYDGLAGGGGVQIGTGPANPNYSIGFTPFTDGQIHSINAYGQDIPTGTWYQLPPTTPVTCTPAVTLTADPPSVAFGGASTLTWSVSNGVNCIASPAGWFNPASLVNGVANSSGSTGPLEDSTLYTLTCTNATGQASSAEVTVGVNVPPPTASVAAITDTDYCTAGPGMVIEWQYDSPAREISAYQVQVLDGAIVVFDTTKTPYAAVPPPPQARSWFSRLTAALLNMFTVFVHAAGPYMTTGTVSTTQGQPGTIDFNTNYDVRVKVWDTDDRESSWSASSNYSTKPGPWPAADFSYQPDKVIALQDIQFTDASSNGPIGWLWDFGDGSTSTLQNPVYTYAADGAYSVTLSATNIGGTCSVTKNLGVSKPIPTYQEVRPGQRPEAEPNP